MSSLPSFTRDQVKKTVESSVRQQLGIDASEVFDEDTSLAKLGGDSLDAIELVMAVEDDLNIELPSGLDDPKTVDELISSAVQTLRLDERFVS